MPDPDRTAFRQSLRRDAYPPGGMFFDPAQIPTELMEPSMEAGQYSGRGDLATAITLLEAALHLRMNGERAPGGEETWAGWTREAEAFLRSRLDGSMGT